MEEGGVNCLRMQLLATSAAARITGEYRLPGTVNYFTGNDPAQWKTGVPTFAQVKYRGLYPGVDLIYYGAPSQLEFDFQLKAGADPEPSKFAGAEPAA